MTQNQINQIAAIRDDVQALEQKLAEARASKAVSQTETELQEIWADLQDFIEDNRGDIFDLHFKGNSLGVGFHTPKATRKALKMLNTFSAFKWEDSSYCNDEADSLCTTVEGFAFKLYMPSKDYPKLQLACSNPDGEQMDCKEYDNLKQVEESMVAFQKLVKDLLTEFNKRHGLTQA